MLIKLDYLFKLQRETERAFDSYPHAHFLRFDAKRSLELLQAQIGLSISQLRPDNWVQEPGPAFILQAFRAAKCVIAIRGPMGIGKTCAFLRVLRSLTF